MSRRRIAAAAATAVIALAAAAIVWQVTRSTPARANLTERSCWSSPDCATRCTAGDGRSCRTLGARYLGRSRLVPSPARAAALLNQACKAGDALGCILLARQIDAGDGVGRDEPRAERLRDDGRAKLERECDKGDVWSCHDLARAQRPGGALSESRQRATTLAARTLELASSQCDEGNGRSCYLLGGLHEGRLDVPIDDDAALAAYTRGCDSGDVNACARGVLDRQACELGSPMNCSRVARPFLYGVGEDVNTAEGIRWEKRACEVGYAPSCVYVAHAALRGSGVNADMSEAVAYAERAISLYDTECDLGDPSACDYVGDTYDEKPLGRSRSAFEARARGTALYETSCAGGNAIHCQVAAFRYGNGLGAIIDPAKSRSLLGEACRLGEQGACEALEPPAPTVDDDISIPADP